MFDPSHPFLSPGDCILLPTGNIGQLDVALKVFILHAEARTSFITYVFSPLSSSHPILPTEQRPSFPFVTRVSFLFNNNFLLIHIVFRETNGCSSNISRGLIMWVRMTTQILATKSTQA